MLVIKELVVGLQAQVDRVSLFQLQSGPRWNRAGGLAHHLLRVLVEDGATAVPALVASHHELEEVDALHRRSENNCVLQVKKSREMNT